MVPVKAVSRDSAETSTQTPPVLIGAVGYLVAAYPAVSHTFIAREIDALRARGVRVRTLSIRKAPPEQLLTDADRRAAAETFSVLPLHRRRFIRAHLLALRRRPVRYLMTLLTALRLSSGGARASLWQLFYFAEAIVVWDECRVSNITHVHAHFANVASAVAMLAADYGRPDGLRWSFTMHGPTEFDDVTRFALAEKVRRAAFVACISDYCRSQLLKLVLPSHWDKLTVVRCGLDFNRDGDNRDGDQDVGLASPETPGPVRVLCVGRLVPDKGQLVLLEAVSELRRRGIGVEASLVGDGPDRIALEAAARRLGVSDCVRFLGSLGHDRVADLYRSSDIFCLPSFAEGLPVVLMEAMWNRLPVVTTRIAGVAELVDDQVSGATVSAGRTDLLTEALARLAADPVLRARWGEAGRTRVRRDYDVGQSADVLKGLFAGGDSRRRQGP